MDKKYNIVYRTTNLINGKIYIGVHSTNKLDDGYIGCGIYRQSDAVREVIRDGNSKHKHSFKGAVVKYGYDNFKREDLFLFNTMKEAYDLEAETVDDTWVKRKDNYNISVGGNIVHIATGRDSYLYKGDIYVIHKLTGDIIGVFPTANCIKKELGLHQAIISKTLKGQSSGIRDLFFTRNPDTWKIDLENILLNFKQQRLNKRGKEITAYNFDGTVFKEFKSMKDASRFFDKGRNGCCYLDDVIDKYRKTDGKPLMAWGYYWKSKNV